MNPEDSISPKQRLLIQSLIDGSIAPCEVPALNELLRNDPLLRGFYIDQMRVDAHLKHHHAHGRTLVFIDKQGGRLSRMRVMAIAVASAGIAAAVTIMVALNYTGNQNKETLAANFSSFVAGPSTAPLARITGISEEVAWTTSTGELQVGNWLPAGRIDLEEGLMEVTYDSGSSVIIKAPSTYYIEADNRGFLEKGNIRAHSPKTVATFEIETPNTQLVDLGTTFGVTTTGITSTAVHVMEGLVKATASSDTQGEWKELREGDALMISNGIEQIAEYETFDAVPEQYEWAPVRNKVRKERVNFHHWSFDSYSDDAFADTGRSIDGSYPAYKEQIEVTAPDEPWLKPDGKAGSALYLNGDTRYLRTDYPGISGNKPRTIACWIKVPKQSKARRKATSFAAWGQASRGGLWKLALRPDRGTGNKLILRTECGYGNTAGETRLNDGEWHHIVSVFTGGTNADAGAHVLQYVDGRLQKRKQTMSRRVDTITNQENAFPLIIGAAIEVPGPSNLNKMRDLHERGVSYVNTFHGLIDELYVFDDALTPEEIVRLMEKNETP